MKNADLKICLFFTKKHGLTLRKKSIFERNANIFLQLPIVSVCRKISSETFLRPFKGPGSKKYPRKDEVRVRVSQKIVCQVVICT